MSSSQKNNNDQFTLPSVFNIKDKVALVTGGGTGIGLMATQALAVNGAKVYISGRHTDKLDRIVEVYGQDIPGRIIPLQGDVTKKEDVEKLVKEIEQKEGCLCILVNNAGIAPGKTTADGKDAEELKRNLFEPTSVQEWTDVYATNVVGPYLMTTAFLPLLQKSTEKHHGWSGCVINITSISGMVKISQGHFSYNASKGAFIHLNRMLSSEIAKAGLKIRVNAIAPGVFPSQMATGEEADEDQKSHLPKDKKGELPAGRPGNDRDMAAAILFAAGCQYLNGQNIAVDGGYLIDVGE